MGNNIEVAFERFVIRVCVLHASLWDTWGPRTLRFHFIKARKKRRSVKTAPFLLWEPRKVRSGP